MLCKPIIVVTSLKYTLAHSSGRLLFACDLKTVTPVCLTLGMTIDIPVCCKFSLRVK